MYNFADTPDHEKFRRCFLFCTGGPVTTNNYGNVVSPSRIDYKVI